MDRLVEQVDADEGEVARRVGRLLDEMHDVSAGVERCDPEAVRVRNLLEQDLGSRWLARCARRLERVDERGEVLLEQVVAEVHHEIVLTEEFLGDENAVGKPERRVLGDVGHRDPELATVADRRHDLDPRVADDDPDLADARSRHCLDAIEEDRLVGDRYQLFGTRVGDGAQARTGPAGENECFHIQFTVEFTVWRGSTNGAKTKPKPEVYC